ncbi:MAG: thymidylate synthase, partial [Oscillospiraceae bacterium]|nr:thymidylate synthase [Oscillospiraceae bacterium]
AFLTMWNVRNTREGKEYLDMCLVQRSGDMLTASGAGGINEVQYAVLLMMIARHTGYEPGVFTHFVANEQIYDRHMEQAEIMLERGRQRAAEPACAAPAMVLNPEKKNFYEITIEDFNVENYDPMQPQLKFPLGI